ncbi:hypothetical protein [Commensalibacter communis]|uniref:hypothetical protein n=1 Tax=Commensalibacter communis TaxID=2972786 RepID=UPI0022FF711A|nr:hypothetical protein [Commensalibacter communis]CAI3958833.1 unnamed protein product [Commensalibacter communis]CAI3959526.1 unnamed protein product [Commensalibacter communis]
MKQAEKVIDKCYLHTFAIYKENTAAIDVCMLGDMLFYTQANKIRELSEAKSQPDPTKDFPYWSKKVFEERFDLNSYAAQRFGYYFLQNQPLFKAYFTDALDDTIRQIHTAQPNCSH